MGDPLVNVQFEVPPDPPLNWAEDARRWRELNATPVVIDGETHFGHPGFYPLTIKAGYVIGTIHDLCSAVTYLLRDPAVRSQFYIPAYGIFAAGVDLLGRCLQGNATHRAGPRSDAPDLLAGFKWLCNPVYPTYEQINPDTIVVETSRARYSVAILMSLQHFAAHGQATTKVDVYEFRDIDDELLGRMPPLLARGLESYWQAIGVHAPAEISGPLCNQLARASIAGFRNGPIYTSWRLFQGDGNGESITNIFHRFN
jgi:hypothetical protein